MPRTGLLERFQVDARLINVIYLIDNTKRTFADPAVIDENTAKAAKLFIAVLNN